MSETTPVLRVDNLGVSYKIKNRWIGAVRDFSIEICPGEIYGVVGESGSGKSTAANAILRFLAPNGRIEPGSEIAFMGEDLIAKSRRDMAAIWGARMTAVPQNPTEALNPAIRIGEQVAEIARRHMGMDRPAARQRAAEMLERVRLADAEGILSRFPHELSGGMQQRVIIAMALITWPGLLILDEPTTALDVTTEAAILDLVCDLIREENAGALYVTHNLGVVAQICDRVTVMYAGEIMEDGPVDELFARPLHPYTIGLLNSVPRPGQTKDTAPLMAIPGQPPALADLPPGCVYAPRCPLALDICQCERPPLDSPAEGRSVRCHRWQEIAAGEALIPWPLPPQGEEEHTHGGFAPLPEGEGDGVRAIAPRENLLKVQNLTKHFPVPRSLIDILRREKSSPVRAVDGVSLSIQKGRTMGLVGESGSGKTTLARLIVGLTDRSGGEIVLAGADIRGNVQQRGKEALAKLQMVFQNPQNSLNPYLTVGESIRRPLVKLAGMSREAANAEARRLLQAVNLRPEYFSRYPDELSGGEKQRVAIARAFASDPALIVCDEPVSALDVSVQAAVLNLLAQLQEERDTSYLFISHDLAVVAYLADYVAVMYLGELYEVGYARDLFTPPLHPYTEALVSAVPRVNPADRTEGIRLEGDIPNPRYMPTGCRFHTRCPRKLGEICEQETPPWRDAGADHFIRCHRTPEELAMLQQETLLPRGSA